MKNLLGRLAVVALLAAGGLGVTGVPAAAASTYLTCGVTTAPNPGLPDLYMTSCVEHFGYPGFPVRAFGTITNWHGGNVTVNMKVSLTGATKVGAQGCSKTLGYGQTAMCTGSAWGVPNPTAKTKLEVASWAPGVPVRYNLIYSPGQN